MKKDFSGGINVNMNEYVSHEVHRLYYDYDENCARTTLKCLSHLFSFPINDDVFSSAIGMHGAGFYRAQCGLVEGTLMFIGLYGVGKGLLRDEIVKLCYDYASSFEKEFSSLRCRELRPGGFSQSFAMTMPQALKKNSPRSDAGNSAPVVSVHQTLLIFARTLHAGHLNSDMNS